MIGLFESGYRASYLSKDKLTDHVQSWAASGSGKYVQIEVIDYTTGIRNQTLWAIQETRWITCHDDEYDGLVRETIVGQ